MTKPKRTREELSWDSPTGYPGPPIDSAALQFALYCVQRERERLSKTAIIDPMADRAMTELERLISTG